jgi:hypothetical protein
VYRKLEMEIGYGWPLSIFLPQLPNAGVEAPVAAANRTNDSNARFSDS